MNARAWLFFLLFSSFSSCHKSRTQPGLPHFNQPPQVTFQKLCLCLTLKHPWLLAPFPASFYLWCVPLPWTGRWISLICSTESEIQPRGTGEERKVHLSAEKLTCFLQCDLCPSPSGLMLILPDLQSQVTEHPWDHPTLPFADHYGKQNDTVITVAQGVDGGDFCFCIWGGCLFFLKILLIY